MHLKVSICDVEMFTVEDNLIVNVIVVVGHEKLNVEMQRTYGSTLTVVKVPKSGGVRDKLSSLRCCLIRLFQVVEVDTAYRERVIQCELHSYMYGQVIKPPPGITNGSLGGENLSDLVLSPLSTAINFSDLKIYRIGSGWKMLFDLSHSATNTLLDTMAPSDALPVGAARTVSEMQPVLVNPGSPGSKLMNSVLALLSPQHPDENERYDEEILDLTVVGFLIM
jgi:polyribonucleotide 5'-hydroxyl-kinase